MTFLGLGNSGTTRANYGENSCSTPREEELNTTSRLTEKQDFLSFSVAIFIHTTATIWGMFYYPKKASFLAAFLYFFYHINSFFYFLLLLDSNVCEIESHVYREEKCEITYKNNKDDDQHLTLLNSNNWP